MKLLFEENTFSEEFKELIGFVDADTDFNSIKSDMISASKEMKKLVGPIYEAAVDVFENEEPTETETELLYHVRYPIALNAFRASLGTSDVQHTVNGRVTRAEEHERAPWEWLIERDDRNQERKYYRALDDLLVYLDEENPPCLIDTVPKHWKDTPEYKKQREYFVNSTDDFDEYFPINSRFLLVRMLPGIRKAERSHILPIIGKEKFDALKTAHEAGNVPEEDETLYERIKEACVYFALAWAMKRLTPTLFPEGALQQFEISSLINLKKKPEKMEAQLAFQEFTKDAESLFREIEALVAPPPVPEPETTEETTYDFGFEEDDKFATT